MSNSAFTVAGNASGTGTVTSVSGTSDITINGASGGSSTSAALVGLATTAVTPGSYTLTNLTVDAHGRITAASDGSIATPISVSDGGTGNTTLGAYEVLCGGGTSTSPIQSVSGLGTAGQVLTSGGPATLPIWAASVGKLIQIQQATLTAPGIITTSGFTPADIGLSVSITPTLSTSKILVIGFICASTLDYGWFTLIRNTSTTTIRGDASGSSQRVTGCFGGNLNIPQVTFQTVPVMYLDSPATTSATSYKIQAISGGGGSPVYINRGVSAPGATSSAIGSCVLIAIEIGA